MDISRRHDLTEIKKGLSSKSSLERKLAGNAASEIKKQANDRWTRQARERLVDETLKGNSENTRQIREDMIAHRGGRQGKGNTGERMPSVSFNISPERYREIFGHD